MTVLLIVSAGLVGTSEVTKIGWLDIRHFVVGGIGITILLFTGTTL